MASNAEVIVPIETSENAGMIGEKSGLESVSSAHNRQFGMRGILALQRMTSSNSRDRTASVKVEGRKDDPEGNFRDALVIASSSRLRMVLPRFMAKSDEYPRFVWQHVLLSFGKERAKEALGPFALEKFSDFIKNFPDIFQREILRDSFQLVPTKDNPLDDRYGALHAAVLCGKSELVYLLRSPNKCREKILKALVPTDQSDDLSDSFHILRRAILWRHMEKMTSSYTKVVEFMREIEKARNPDHKLKSGELIDKVSASQIDLSVDSHDPWIVILAWSSVTSERGRIFEQFKERQPKLFKHIVTTLTNLGSDFIPFLTSPPAEETVQVKRTVQDIVTILVLQKKKTVGDIVNLNREHSNISPMQKFFLDRFCERTPNTHWTPLHLAAARGDQKMVNALIVSWDVLLEKLVDELKDNYIRNLEKSFYDAKYMTPLHYAALGNHKEVVKELLAWPMFAPHVNECDIFMRAPFQIACSKQERASIVKELVKNQRVDVNTKDCCFFTSLHWAVHSESTETVKHMILDDQKRTIRTIEKDIRGQNPYEMAARGKGHSHKDIQQLLLHNPAVKDQVERLYRDRQVYADASNAILLGAALIASVTFGGWLQPPSGSDQDGANSRDVRIFWSFNSLSFFFSIATVTSGAAAVLPVGNEYIKDTVESIKRWLVVTSCLLILSVASVLGAFAAAGFASISKVPNWTASDNINMTTTTGVGSAVCAIIGSFFIARLWSVRPEWLSPSFKASFQRSLKEIRRKMDSVIRLWMTVFNRIREQVCLRRPSESQGEVEHSPQPYGPENTPNMKPVLEALPVVMSSAIGKSFFRTSSFADAQASLPSIEVDRERIRDLWVIIHPKDDVTVSCPFRTSYVQIELSCVRDIMNLNALNTDDSLEGYIQMWKKFKRKVDVS